MVSSPTNRKFQNFPSISPTKQNHPTTHSEVTNRLYPNHRNIDSKSDFYAKTLGSIEGEGSAFVDSEASLVSGDEREAGNYDEGYAIQF